MRKRNKVALLKYHSLSQQFVLLDKIIALDLKNSLIIKMRAKKKKIETLNIILTNLKIIITILYFFLI